MTAQTTTAIARYHSAIETIVNGGEGVDFDALNRAIADLESELLQFLPQPEVDAILDDLYEQA